MKELIIQDYKDDSIDFPNRLKFQIDRIILPTHSIVYDIEMLAAIEEAIEQFNEMSIEVHPKDFDSLDFHKDFLLFYLRSKENFIPSIKLSMDRIAFESIEFIGIQIIGSSNNWKINNYGEMIDIVYQELVLYIKQIFSNQNISIEKINFDALNIITVLYIFLRLVGKINFIKKEI